MPTAWKLKLDRPLAVFDIEATGINARSDRIVELAIVKVNPRYQREQHTFRINPDMKIPPEATAIHGITDADVAQCLKFTELAPRIAEILQDCDLAGYNILHYDIPMLTEEFARAKIAFSMDGRRVFDAQRIFHKKEPRDLAAALKFYCGELHLGAHGALEDVMATLRVMDGQFARYRDLPQTMDEMDAFCVSRDPSWADRTGKLKWAEIETEQGKQKEIVINFGKKLGAPLRALARHDKSYLQWIINGDFPADTRRIVQDTLDGKFPKPPAD